MPNVTVTANVDANASVTPLNAQPLKDALGVVLEKGMRVETLKGERAVVLRLDTRSRRAVIDFEPVEGEAPRNATMRAAHLLKARKHAGKILFVKKVIKAAKITK